ncbi:MAG: hypothetical protein JJU45_13355 [Acidimicrobiia bacterium]|nr:hypothetical protein [Acidimicrobiia bacterium]
MTAEDLATLLVAITATVVVAVAVLCTVALVRALAATRRTLDRLDRRLDAALVELERTAAQATREVRQLDEVLDEACALTAELDATNRFVDATVTNPLIRAVALLRGAGRAARGRNRRARRRARRAARRRTDVGATPTASRREAA